MGTVIHFEINAEDPQRAAEFYSKALGWQIQAWEGPLEYLLCATHAEGTPGIDGAIMRAEKRGQGTINTIEVAEIQSALKAINAAGGKQISEVQPIPTIGLFCYCEDTEGNLFGILQPEMP